MTKSIVEDEEALSNQIEVGSTVDVLFESVVLQDDEGEQFAAFKNKIAFIFGQDISLRKT